MTARATRATIVTVSNAGVKILATVLGFWVVMRSVHKDASGRTLVNYLTGSSGDTASQPAPAVSPGAAAGKAAITAHPISTGQILPTIERLAQQHGWDANEVNDWARVINQESGGSTTAKNPSSGAYGIAQFIQGLANTRSTEGTPRPSWDS